MLRREQALAGFEELAFFGADVSGEEAGELAEAGIIEFELLGAGEALAQGGVLGEQLLDQGLELGKSGGGGKEGVLFGGEVAADFHIKQGACLELQFGERGGSGAVNLHAQGEGVLVLVGERDEIAVAQHGAEAQLY